VTAGYGRTVILRHVSLSVRAGQLTGLVGANGSGKTTLLRVVLGLLPIREGTVTRRGDRPLRVGYVPQADSSEILFPVTALDVVTMGLTPSLGPWRRPGAAERGAARRALGRLGVQALEPRLFRSLSGGQRQRVLLARAMVADPDLLVLDEPVRGLDLSSSEALVRHIAGFAREGGIAVLVATHSLDLVANHADQVAVFHDGETEVGPSSEILTDEVLTRYHGQPVAVRTVDGRKVVLPGGPG